MNKSDINPIINDRFIHDMCTDSLENIYTIENNKYNRFFKTIKVHVKYVEIYELINFARAGMKSIGKSDKKHMMKYFNEQEEFKKEFERLSKLIQEKDV